MQRLFDSNELPIPLAPLLTRITDIDRQERLANLVTSRRLAEDGTNVREDTVICRLATYQSIRSKAQVYADLLGLRQDAIRSEIGELEAQARRLLLHDAQPAKAKQQRPETVQEKSKPARHTENADEIERLPLLYLNGTGHPSLFPAASQTAGD